MKSLLLLMLAVVLAAACSPKRDDAVEATPEKAAEKSESGSPSILNAKATIDHVQKQPDAAAAKDAKRREEMEAQTK